ncbi:response regulator [Tautonia sp. JC769]|uniref:response regulator n=1 Tax=Tautonia sp. JC769 TaxID=3232135 RepID=UPI0034581C67
MSDSRRILVIDDEPNIRLTFRTALEAAGYAVAEAADADAALAFLEEHVAGLALLDLRMPGAGGMELLRRLRAAGDVTPVIVVSAHGTLPDAVEALKLGAIDFVQKPIDPEALRRTVSEVLDRHDPEPGGPGPTESTGDVALARAKRAINRCEFDDAEDFLRRAIDSNPSSSEAHNLLGVLHSLLGDHGAALKSFRMARFIAPADATARNNLLRCEELLRYGNTRRPLGGIAEGPAEEGGR